MILNMMDLMVSDEITENADGIRLKPDITEIGNVKKFWLIGLEINCELD